MGTDVAWAVALSSADTNGFDSIEPSEKLTHLTATRAKGPQKRPPSHITIRENQVSCVCVHHQVVV